MLPSPDRAPDHSPDHSVSQRVTIVVAVVDRDVRRAWSDALSASRYAVRSVSRAAELAKSLSDGVPRLVVRREHADDLALTAQTHYATIALDESIDTGVMLTRIHEALAPSGER